MVEKIEKNEYLESIDLADMPCQEVDPIEEKMERCEMPTESEVVLGRFRESPYESGFDAEHPLPTYEQLRNAGFTNNEARIIRYGHNANYSQKELYKVLYESDDPVKAYRKMIKEKVDELINRPLW